VNATPQLHDVSRLFPSVVERIKRENHVRRKTAERWLLEALRFLDACAESPEPISPSKKVDAAWHAFILHTRQYTDWCEKRYGQYIHHVPSGKPDPRSYVRAYRLLTTRHGRLSPRVWPPPRSMRNAGGLVAGGAVCGDGGGHHGDGGASCGGSGCGGGGCGGGAS
jgi:hypothetical protein